MNEASERLREMLSRDGIHIRPCGMLDSIGKGFVRAVKETGDVFAAWELTKEVSKKLELMQLAAGFKED